MEVVLEEAADQKTRISQKVLGKRVMQCERLRRVGGVLYSEIL
jgi:hypothetical protein